MILPDAKFERIEQKISDIQAKIDEGITASSMSAALNALRGARVELFALRTIISESIVIDSPTSPSDPEAA